MAIRHQYTILCHYVVRAADGQLTFVDSFVNLIFNELPIKYLFYVAMGFSGDVGDELVISVEGPDGKVWAELVRDRVAEAEEIASGKKDKSNTVTIATYYEPMINFEFKSEGIYSITLRQGKRLVHRFPFGVAIRKKAEG